MSEKLLPVDWHISTRPRTFAEVHGNDTIKQYFKNVVKTGAWSKAFLFVAAPGAGKTTFAKIIAKYLSCAAPKSDGQPCDECLDCRAINEEKWTRDVALLDGNDKDKMSATEARAYVDKFCSFPASRGKNKVLILDEAGKLSKEAISAFLKPLESPREGFYFIFTTMEGLGKDPSSIALQRRCKIFKMSTPRAENIYLYLASIAKKLDLTSDQNIPKSFWTEGLELISRSCNFSYGQAISMFEQCFTGWIFDPSEMKQVLAIVDEENLNKALDDLCYGRITDVVRETMLEPSDYSELFNFAYYRLVQARILVAFGKTDDGDWRQAVAEKLASAPYFDVVLRHFNALSDASTQFLRKNRYQQMVADLVIELKSMGEPPQGVTQTAQARRVVKK